MCKTLLRNLVFLAVAGIGSAQILGLGHNVELRLLGGVAFGKAVINSPSPTGGVELAYRFNRAFAVTADYQHLGAAFCFDFACAKSQQSGRINDEFVIGTRFSVPNRSRITPHFILGIGSARYVHSSSSTPHTDVAVAAGLGVDVRLTPRFGITTEVRRVAPAWAWVLEGSTFRSYGRTAAGAYFRF